MKKDNYPEFQPACCFGPPKCAGVYAVIEVLENQKPFYKTLYIGSSKNINKRVLKPNHWYMKLYNKGYNVVTRSYPCDNYKQEEVRLIKKYNPTFNKQHKNMQY